MGEMKKKKPVKIHPNTARLAAAISDQLVRRNMRQKELAERIDMKEPSLSRLLRAKADFKMETVRRIAEVFGAAPQDLLGPYLPFIGTVSAGPGIEEPAGLGEVVEVTRLIPPGTVSYRVRGDSMRDALIDDGDCLLVRKKPDPAVGDIVVVYVPDVGMVVKLKQAGHYASLNDGHPQKPIPRTDECEEYGVLIGVIRKVPPDSPTKRRKLKA